MAHILTKLNDDAPIVYILNTLYEHNKDLLNKLLQDATLLASVTTQLTQLSNKSETLIGLDISRLKILKQNLNSLDAKIRTVLEAYNTYNQSQSEAKKVKQQHIPPKNSKQNSVNKGQKNYAKKELIDRGVGVIKDNYGRLGHYKKFNLSHSAQLLYKKSIEDLTIIECDELKAFLKAMLNSDIRLSTQNSTPIESGEGYTTFVFKIGADCRLLLIQTDEVLVFACKLDSHKDLGEDHQKYRENFKRRMPLLLTEVNQLAVNPSSTGSSSIGVKSNGKSQDSPKSSRASKKGGSPKSNGMNGSSSSGVAMPEQLFAEATKPTSSVRPLQNVTLAQLKAESENATPELLDPMNLSKDGMIKAISRQGYGAMAEISLFKPFESKRGKPKNESNRIDLCSDDLKAASKVFQSIYRVVKTKLDSLTNQADLKEDRQVLLCVSGPS